MKCNVILVPNDKAQHKCHHIVVVVGVVAALLFTRNSIRYMHLYYGRFHINPLPLPSLDRKKTFDDYDANKNKNPFYIEIQFLLRK